MVTMSVSDLERLMFALQSSNMNSYVCRLLLCYFLPVYAFNVCLCMGHIYVFVLTYVGVYDCCLLQWLSTIQHTTKSAAKFATKSAAKFAAKFTAATTTVFYFALCHPTEFVVPESKHEFQFIPG